MNVEFVPEPGCPVAVTNGRAELDLDPFDVPVDARIYIDYKNNSERAISAVKFRLRFCDAEGNDRGTWHAPDLELIAPGASGTEKWKHEKVDPRITSLKVRMLQVKFQDNSNWTSVKMGELATPGSGATGGGGVPVQTPVQSPVQSSPPKSNSIIPDIPAQQSQQAVPQTQAQPASAGNQQPVSGGPHAPAGSDPFSP